VTYQDGANDTKQKQRGLLPEMRNRRRFAAKEDGKAQAVPASIDWSKAFRAEVGQTKNPRTALNRLRAKLGNESPSPVFKALRSNVVFTMAVAMGRMPSKFGQIGHHMRLRPRGFANDLRWSAEVIVQFADEMASFLKLRKRFDDAYIRGDVDQCIEALDVIEKSHGLSLWLISRMTLLLRRSGANAQGEYTSALLASGHTEGITSYLTYLIGYRSDPNVSPAAFERALARVRLAIEMPETLRSFLLHHLDGSPPACENDCAAILEVGETAPLVDRYEALIVVLQRLAAFRSSDNALQAEAAVIALRLADILPDARLVTLKDVMAEKDGYQDLVARLRTDEADAYTRGEYDKAHALMVDELAANPQRVELFPLLARTRRRTGASLDSLPPFVENLVTEMAKAYAFEEGSDSAVSALVREATAGAHSELSACIRALLASRRADLAVPTLEDHYDALNARELTPLQLRNLPVKNVSSLMTTAVSRRPASLALQLQAAVSEFGDQELPEAVAEALPPDRRALYKARALRRLNRHEEAITQLVTIGKDEEPTANDAMRELFGAYVALNDINEALRVVAKAQLANPALHPIFQLEPLLDTIEQRADGPPYGQISLSICYHIYNRHHSDSRLSAQADAAEEYALASNASLPSQAPMPTGIDEPLFPLYLDQVCSAPVLDKFMAVDSVNDVELERLEICRKLVEIDSIKRQQYQEEIREITRRRVVRERFEQVERTKIYVDTDGVKRQAEKAIREAYQRFLAALADPTHGDEALEMMRQIKGIIAGAEADGVKIHFPDLPTNERDQLFDDIVRDLMRMLISSQEYGLEAYLSTRVRHGTMGNQLRSAFETNALLTQKDDGRYVADYTWSEQLDLTDMHAWSWLAQRLADFSEQIDSAIEELVREKVQVRSEALPSGLFVFATYNYDTLQLQSEITADTPFDVFVDKVINRFWSVLDDSLEVVRAHMNNKFLGRVLELTDELQVDVNRELAGVNISALSDAIASARTQMAVNVANVANWFTLAREMERPDYEFGIAVEVATQSIVACHPTLGFDLKRTDDVSFECRGRSLESLVYVLFTALDNVVEHSGLADEPPDVTLSTTLSDGWLWLSLTNSCSKIENIDEANLLLAARRRRLENASDLQSLATTEGGSGYAKIIRILKHDLLAQHSIEFGYIGPTEYQVRIGVETKAIVR
jgi:hypothetical protein